METTQVNKEELLQFIAKAHRNTYAAPKEVRRLHRCEQPILAGHKDYDFKEGDWEYHDSYAGQDWAPGREVVFLKGKPVWAMAYQGKHNESYPSEFFQNQAFSFLRNALRNISDEMPFRGPESFKEGDFEYTFKMNGDYQYFTGREAITYKGIEVFFQDIMGELIK